METKSIKWLEISDSQRTQLITQARDCLRQQVADARLCNSIAEAYLPKTKEN